jgi:hypothetical protein
LRTTQDIPVNYLKILIKNLGEAPTLETIDAHRAQWRDFRHNLLVAPRKMHRHSGI